MKKVAVKTKILEMISILAAHAFTLIFIYLENLNELVWFYSQANFCNCSSSLKK